MNLQMLLRECVEVKSFGDLNDHKKNPDTDAGVFLDFKTGLFFLEFL